MWFKGTIYRVATSQLASVCASQYWAAAVADLLAPYRAAVWCGGESRKVGKTSIDVQRESAWLRLITTKPDISLLPTPVCCKASTAATPALPLAPLYRRSTCTPTRRASSSRRALCCSTLAFFSTACFSRPPSCPAVNASAWLQVLLCALLSAPLPDTLLALPPL